MNITTTSVLNEILEDEYLTERAACMDAGDLQAWWSVRRPKVDMSKVDWRHIETWLAEGL